MTHAIFDDNDPDEVIEEINSIFLIEDDDNEIPVMSDNGESDSIEDYYIPDGVETYSISEYAKTDAKSRAYRTSIQGIFAVVIVSVVNVVADTVTPENVFTSDTWATIGTSVITVSLVAIASYVQRRNGK